MVRRLALLLVLLAALGIVSAHLSGGKHVSTDQYFLEIGHTPDPITAEETTTFLLTAAYKNGTQAHVDSVHVTIRRNTTVLAATMQANDAGSVSFNYAFPEPGTYDVTTTFREGQQTLTKHTTQLIAKHNDDAWYDALWPFLS